MYMVSAMANAQSLLLRPLREDEIEAVRMVEKVTRSRYRALGEFFAQAAEAPAIAAERFLGGETIVAELRHASVGFLLLRPLDDWPTWSISRSAPMRLALGSDGCL
jgi:hypothetical protein